LAFPIAQQGQITKSQPGPPKKGNKMIKEIFQTFIFLSSMAALFYAVQIIGVIAGAT
tara:strand:+ start:492 stop:662 length:171 start_codon:yes stop_codon:yes gene_type:complete